MDFFVRSTTLDVSSIDAFTWLDLKKASSKTKYPLLWRSTNLDYFAHLRAHAHLASALSLSLSHTLSHSHSYSLFLTLAIPLSHSLAWFRTLSYKYSLILKVFFSFSLSFSNQPCLCHFLFALSDILPRLHKHFLRPSLSISNTKLWDTLALSSCALSLSPFSLSLCFVPSLCAVSRTERFFAKNPTFFLGLISTRTAAEDSNEQKYFQMKFFRLKNEIGFETRTKRTKWIYHSRLCVPIWGSATTWKIGKKTLLQIKA